MKKAGLLTVTSLLLVLSAYAHAQETAEPEVARVTTQALGELTFFPAYSAPARVISLNQSRISARLNARIDSIRVRVGDRVKKNDVLVELDCSDATLNRTAAQSRRDLAQREFNRLSKLKKANVTTEQNLNAAEADLSQARVAWRQAQLQVSRCEVKAPYTGIVTARTASEGELASPGTPLLSLTDTESLEVVAEISPADSKTLARASKTLYEWNNSKYPVSIRSLSPVINPDNRNREIRLLFDRQKALAGSAGRIHWQSTVAHVPADLLLERSDSLGVFINNQGIARFHTIADAQAGQPTVIDLPSDTPIVVEGRFGLQDGDRLDAREL